MIKISDITIDPELESLLPPLSTEENAELIISIGKDGYTDPIIVWLGHNTLVDGHNRVRIWNLNGANEDEAPEVIEKPFADRDAVKEWMLRHQLARRNLTDAGRIKVTLMLKPYLEKKAKANLSAAGKNKGKEPLANLPKAVEEPVNTRKELAELAGVSERTFAKAETVLETAPEEIKAAMLAPKTDASHISIDKAYQKTKAASAEPAPAKEADQARQIKPLGVGVERAHEAIACLKRIPKNDALRVRAFQIVSDWIKQNKD